MSSPLIYVRIPSFDVNEGSSFEATLNFRQDGADVTPAAGTVKFRVDCLTTGQEIKDWTATATPTQPMQLAIVSGYNDIITESNRREKKQLTISYNIDSDDQYTTTQTYYVTNLKGTP